MRSLAKKTFGSTRVGRAMRLPGEGRGGLAIGVRREEVGGCFFWGTLGEGGGLLGLFLVILSVVDLPGAVWRRGWLDMICDV